MRFFLHICKKSSNFAAENLVLRASRRDVSQIKRESGENPEQTRCCKSRPSCHTDRVTVRQGWEGRVTMG